MLPSYWKCHGVALSDRQIRRSDYTPLMHWLLPVVAAAASAAFAAAVLRQYAARRRPHQLAWGIALSMFAVASLALTAGVTAGWSPLSFKAYYLFGAVLNVPWLALGTVELLARPALRRAYVAGLAAFTVGTVVVVGGAVASGLALRSRRDLRPRFEGNLLIALGVLLAASGGVFAFLASSDKLALGLALGASVMYLGFRRASAPVRPAVPSGP